MRSRAAGVDRSVSSPVPFWRGGGTATDAAAAAAAESIDAPAPPKMRPPWIRSGRGPSNNGRIGTEIGSGSTSGFGPVYLTIINRWVILIYFLPFGTDVRMRRRYLNDGQ